MFLGLVRERLAAGATRLSLLIVVLAGVAFAQAAAPQPGRQNHRYFTSRTVVAADGTSLEELVINGPPTPPPGYELERSVVALPEPSPETGLNTLTVPAYAWTFGCSATSGSMIAAYYDRLGFSNIYTGPSNGGVMPLDSSSWGSWKDGAGSWYAQCPLAASRNGLDGRASRGSIDDYWVSYLGGVQDPYITNGWAQHTWGDAIGDYMKTSQSASGNDDGSTSFWSYGSAAQLQCSAMPGYGITNDGTYGRQAFYQARGYTVTACYNQKTDNQVSGGFSFAQFEGEIDAGRPVMLNLVGHTIVGVGYDSSSNTVYLHDTWDYNTHTMVWGGSYAGMALQSVSIVDIARSGAKFFPLTPCRLVDTRHGPKDVKEPGNIAPVPFPRGSYSDGEVRSYDLTLSSDCTGLPAGVTAWSLLFQFTTATQPSYLQAWPYVSALGIGSQAPPSSESTMLGYTDRWSANSAIIPAGNDPDGSINVLVQHAGDVIVEVNGYFK